MRTRSVPPSFSGPGYALRAGFGAWELVFEGQRAVLQDERGLRYVAWLLRHPHERPIHALDLALRVLRAGRGAAAGTATFAAPSGLPRDYVLQERNLGRDDAETALALLAKRRQLEALLENEEEPELVKAEARQELEIIARFQNRAVARTRDNARRTTDAVRKAIERFWQRISRAQDAEGNPHPVLRLFAAHLHGCLLLPSGRGGRRGASRAHGALPPGCFVYTPSPGVRWESA